VAPLLGSTIPRVYTPPLVTGPAGPCGCGCALTPETTVGFAVVTFALEILGITLLPWQRWLLIHALELLPDGTFRFRTVVVLVARQNGKSTLAQVLALFFLYIRQVGLVIGTAQNLDIAEEVWAGAVQMAEETPELAEEIKRVVQVNGKKALELYGGPRYKVQAANRRGGRGLSGDLVILDELREHHTWDAWGAVTKTTLARAFAQIWALSNAGDAASVPLRHLRRQAHDPLGDPDGISRAMELPGMDDPVAAVEVINAAEEVVAGAADSLGIFEWSAPPGCPLDDPHAIAQANPSLGRTITLRAILSALATDPEHVYRTEVLCQWIEGTILGPFKAGSWEAGTDPLSEIPLTEKVWHGLDVSADRGRAHIGVVGRRSDGDWHGEVIASRVGTEWVKPWFAERCSADNPMEVAVQGRGAPVAALIDDLNTVEGLTVTECVGVEVGKGTGRLWDAVAAHVTPPEDGDPAPAKFWHRPQPILDGPAATAATRPLGDGAWGWDRVKSPVDAASLVAVNMAFWLATRTTEPARRSAYDEGAALMVLD